MRKERQGSTTAAPPRVRIPGARRPSWSDASAPCGGRKASGRTASSGRSASPAPRSTPCCKRHGLHRLDRLHRVTREPVRYEHAVAGDLLHLDVKKLGRIPEGGGKRIAPGFAETRSGPRPGRSLGLEYLHVAVDDHSRYAYVAALPDERAATCAAFLERALAAFCRRGVRVRGVLTDNAKAYTVARRFLERGRRRRRAAVAHAGLTAHRPTARPSASSRSCRTSGHTPAPTAPTPSGYASSRAGSTATITADRTAASAGPSPPPACEQPSWVVQLAGGARPEAADDRGHLTLDPFVPRTCRTAALASAVR